MQVIDKIDKKNRYNNETYDYYVKWNDRKIYVLETSTGSPK